MGTAWMAIIAVSSTCAHAQDDPFARPGGAKSTPTTTQPLVASSAAGATQLDIDENLPDSIKLVIRAINDSNPSTGPEFVRAIRRLMDIEQFDHAKSYLSRLESLGGTDQQLFELSAAAGSDFFLELNSTAAMQPEGAAYALKVVTAANRAANDPARINALIKQLNDLNITVRSDAFRKLKRLGPVAAAELINVFADDSREAEFPGVRAALAKMGRGAILPLQGGLRANHLMIQAESIRALSFYALPQAADGLFRVYFSPRIPESIKKYALNGLQSVYGNDISQSLAEKTLAKLIDRYMGDAKIIDSSSLEGVTLWRWNSASKRLMPRKLPNEIAAKIVASDYSADLYQINSNESSRSLYRLTHLEAAKHLVGPTKKVDVADLISLLQLNKDNTLELLAKSIAADYIPAAIACSEVLAEIGDKEQLYTVDGKLSPLVNAILTGDRHLQYASLSAIQKLDPERAFPGSSYVTSLAVFLATSSGQPEGLVGYRTQGMGQSHAAMLMAGGLVGVGADGSRDFFNKATNNSNLVAMFVAETMVNPNYVELIQQLRNDWRTKRIPIGVLSLTGQADPRLYRQLRQDPFTTVLAMSTDRRAVQSQIQQLNALARPWPVSDAQRWLHSEANVNWLAKIAGQRQKYRFYDLGQHQHDVARMLYAPGNAAIVSEILAAIGTPNAQRELITYASQTNLAAEDRRIVAKAFAESVAKSGPLLTTAEIKLQYQRYNASEFDTKESQEILGSLLDAIETRKRNTLRIKSSSNELLPDLSDSDL